MMMSGERAEVEMIGQSIVQTATEVAIAQLLRDKSEGAHRDVWAVVEEADATMTHLPDTFLPWLLGTVIADGLHDAMEKYQTFLAKLLTLQKIGVIQMPHAHGLRSAVSVLVAQQLEEHFYRAALAATEEARTSLAAFSEVLARN